MQTHQGLYSVWAAWNDIAAIAGLSADRLAFDLATVALSTSQIETEINKPSKRTSTNVSLTFCIMSLQCRALFTPASPTSIPSPQWLVGNRGFNVKNGKKKNMWTPAWTTCLSNGPPRPSKNIHHVSSHRSAPSNSPSMPVQHAHAARSLHEVDQLVEQWRELRKENNERDSYSVSQRILPQDTPTSLPSSIRCHDRSGWGSYQCACSWVRVCEGTQRPSPLR